jgi:hypothetical protein
MESFRAFNRTRTSVLKESHVNSEAGPAWRATAQACRWGVVLLCLTLVPGVAFLGQGIGRWLRVQTASRWNTRMEYEDGSAEAPLASDLADVPVVSMEPLPAIAPDESAAMYAGGRQETPPDVQGAGVGVIPVSHTVEETGISPPAEYPTTAVDRFTDLEQVLRERGAISYSLESDRRSRLVYRFVCVMPPDRAGEAERTVEASGTTALEAIQRVVRQLGSLPSATR